MYMIFNQKLNKTGGANDKAKTKWKTMKQYYNSLLQLQGKNDDSIHSFSLAEAEAPAAYGGFDLFHFARLPFFQFTFFNMEERFLLLLEMKNLKSKTTHNSSSLIFFDKKNRVFDKNVLRCNKFCEFLNDSLFFNFYVHLAIIYGVVDFYVTWTW